MEKKISIMGTENKTKQKKKFAQQQNDDEWRKNFFFWGKKSIFKIKIKKNKNE